ncbi:MAG: alanine racemase [Phycisphaeraceae bacterium]|nr:alanine racemase [Phycisphaeraceae bacterium]
MNKFGASPIYARRVRTEIEGVAVDDLVARFGSPLFVFSETRLRERYHSLYQAFATRYPHVTFGWSYKTNYLQAICAILHQEGAIAEVVSEFEYDKARKLGVPAESIIFNGPYKPISALRKAVGEGARINIDHADEIQDLEQVAVSLGRSICVGMRLNMDTGIHPQWSRFGFNLESGEALDIVKRLAHSDKLILNGLHCHIGTFIMEPTAYAKQVEKMVTFGYQLEDQFGFKMDYLDLGGGLPSRSKLKGAYLPPDVGIPPMEEYAEAITNALYRHLRPGDQPQLILENGRALVDESGSLITSIIARKRLPDGRRAYVVDAGINDLFTSLWYRFNVEIDREVHGMNEQSVVYGPLCMNIDVLDEGILLPRLGRGVRLIVSPVGAYNVTQWMQFIHYRPNVVLIGTEGQVDCIREAEDLSDIERRERLPQRLEIA